MSRTKLILLGTGSPGLEKGTAQTAMVVLVDETAYFVDCGSGMLQRAIEAGLTKDQMSTLFITHLHPDHTLGLADFIIAPWVKHRKDTVLIHGPKGINDMCHGLVKLYHVGIEQHRVGGPLVLDDLDLEVWEIGEGVIYEDDLVSVEAFAVDHAGLETYGLKFVTPDKTIVFSADTIYLPKVAEMAKGCDILVHECFAAKAVVGMNEKFVDYFYGVHSSAEQVGKIAHSAQPKLLVLNHQMHFNDISHNDVTPDDFIREVREGGFEGEVVYGRDLDVFE